MRNKIVIYFLILISAFILSAQISYAEDCTGASPVGGPVKLCNPLGSGADKTDIPKFLGTVINYAMGIIGSLALVMFIYGGLTWMLSGGNQEQVTKGKNTVIWAALGIALIFTSYALVKFVITAIGGQ